MNYEVVWSDFAVKELEKIHSYYFSIVSENIASRIALNIVKMTTHLKYNTYLGSVEPLLKARLVEYRYLVKGKH
jgi:mRNA-degrading endonuclease RelE of RelBE toxin-antitoxin system